MTIPTLALWFLTLAALSASIFALFAVLRSSAHAQSKQLYEHSMQLEQLTLQLRNLRSRLNMAAYRERKASEAGSTSSITENDDAPDAQRDPDAWKRAMNRTLALKGIKR